MDRRKWKRGWCNKGIYVYGTPEQRAAQPRRQGARWTEVETQEMLHKLFLGYSISSIARDHQRSVGGIEMRLLHCQTSVPQVAHG